MANDIVLWTFTICYAIAFLLEICWHVSKNMLAQRPVLAVALCGCLFQAWFIGFHYIFQDSRIVTNISGWFFVLSWGMVLCWLYFLIFYRKSPWSLFFVPLIILLIIAALYTENFYFPQQVAGRSMRAIHGIFLLLTCGCVLIGCVTGMMYFLQRRQLRGKSTKHLIPLPSLEWLETANRRSLKLSVVLLGFGIMSGFYIERTLALSAGVAERSFLFDPMIGGSLILFVFMSIFLCTVSFTRHFQGGRTIALFTIACFLFLLSLLVIGVLYRQTHWYDQSLASVVCLLPYVREGLR